MHDDLDVGIDHQIPKRGEIPEGKGVEGGDQVGQRNLNEAEPRPVRAILNEFSIPSETTDAAELRADF